MSLFICGLLLGVVVVGVFVFLVDRAVRIPPDSMTELAIIDIVSRIKTFYAMKGRLPHEISELPVLKAPFNRTTDGWGNQLVFKVKEGEVIVGSYGADGRPVGDGNDLVYEAVISKGKATQELTISMKPEWPERPAIVMNDSEH